MEANTLMPYSSVGELPANIKKLPAKKQRQWMHVFNSAMKKHGKEATAFKMANSVIGSNAEYELVEINEELEILEAEEYVANYPIDEVDMPEVVQPIKLTSADYKPGTTFILNENNELVVQEAASVVSHETPNNSNDWGSHFGGLLRRAGQSLGIGAKAATAEFTLYKTADNTLKFMAWWSNCFQDKASITIPISAQKDVVSWADSIQEYPKMLLWHAPLTEFAQVEMLDFVDGFNVAFGSILPGKEDVAYRLAEYEGGIGCSHGSLYETEGDSILRIRPFEITALPSNKARNSWTHFLAGNWEEAMGFTDEKKKFLKDIGGLTDEQISASENATVAMTAALKKNGIAWADDSPPDLVGIQDSITKLAEGVATLAATIQEQQAAIEPIKAEVAELKANKTTLDDQVANELASASRQRGHVASQADTNLVSSELVTKDKDKVFSIFEEVKAGLSSLPS
jgi:cation transport regulator ChaB